MGKRSTNTTKSGKFMNPTDQARKEARRRELKKNKKQRQMVRFYIPFKIIHSKCYMFAPSYKVSFEQVCTTNFTVQSQKK